MINLYLSDFILGIDRKNQHLSLNDIIYEFEKLFEKISEIKKDYKSYVGDVYSFENHQIDGYSLKDIVSNIKNKELKSYMHYILTKKQYLKSEQTEQIEYNNIAYNSNIASQCYQNKGILINIILKDHFTNRLPYSDSYITIIHKENYDYIRKFILLDDTFYLSRIYLNMLNSGYNLFFHIQAYNTLYNDYVSLADIIDNVIQYILDSNLIEHYDKIHVRYERNGIGVIKKMIQ